ncbi:MAG: hypothetical protein KAH77_06455 [Thiomargarita sp.]|nr:hypothetical protein [Thiomargarita sp.]
MDSPIVIAIIVFISIYVIWYLIRVFADFILVSIALSSAVLSYYIPNLYPSILVGLKEMNLLNILGMTWLPEQADFAAIIAIACLIVGVAVLISIPILPFSATYRSMLGIEGSVFKRKEAKIRQWIIEEVQHYHDKNINENSDRN